MRADFWMRSVLQDRRANVAGEGDTLMSIAVLGTLLAIAAWLSCWEITLARKTPQYLPRTEFGRR
jgi:hypothetical protein